MLCPDRGSSATLSHVCTTSAWTGSSAAVMVDRVGPTPQVNRRTLSPLVFVEPVRCVTLRLPSEPLSTVRFQSVLQPVALQKLPFSDRRPHPQADHVCSVPIAVMLASHDSSRALPFADGESIENHPCTTCLGATLPRHVLGCSWQHACSATARAI